MGDREKSKAVEVEYNRGPYAPLITQRRDISLKSTWFYFDRILLTHNNDQGYSLLLEWHRNI